MDCSKRDDEINSRYHEEVMKTRKKQSNIEYDGGTEDTSSLQKQGQPFEDGPERFDKETRWTFRNKYNAGHIKRIFP